LYLVGIKLRVSSGTTVLKKSSRLLTPNGVNNISVIKSSPYLSTNNCFASSQVAAPALKPVFVIAAYKP